jgi:hypothetical protein
MGVMTEGAHSPWALTGPGLRGAVPVADDKRAGPLAACCRRHECCAALIPALICLRPRPQRDCARQSGGAVCYPGHRRCLHGAARQRLPQGWAGRGTDRTLLRKEGPCMLCLGREPGGLQRPREWTKGCTLPQVLPPAKLYFPPLLLTRLLPLLPAPFLEHAPVPLCPICAGRPSLLTRPRRLPWPPRPAGRAWRHPPFPVHQCIHDRARRCTRAGAARRPRTARARRGAAYKGRAPRAAGRACDGRRRRR